MLPKEVKCDGDGGEKKEETLVKELVLSGVEEWSRTSDADKVYISDGQGGGVEWMEEWQRGDKALGVFFLSN